MRTALTPQATGILDVIRSPEADAVSFFKVWCTWKSKAKAQAEGTPSAALRCSRLQARVGGESWIRCSGELHPARVASFDAFVQKRPLPQALLQALLQELQASLHRKSLPEAAALAYAIEVRTAALHICSAADGSIAGSSYSCGA